MKNNKQWLQEIEELEDNLSPYSHYILRHLLIPELLGEDESTILYWAGKSIARKINEQSGQVELIDFFNKANWGELSLQKEKKSEFIYELIAPQMTKERPFTLESGFLAQWIELEKGFMTEATYSVKKNKPCTIKIIVRWDTFDPTRNKDEIGE